MEYVTAGKRKTKKDLKRKRLRRVYKRGGKFRSSEVKEGREEKKGKKAGGWGGKGKEKK